ncbi:Sfi1 spindle body protein-domain-containing protein [Russula brevipes]|nr:Sfi1 spindle body protein-domain-containing protein [Russula brevipes]
MFTPVRSSTPPHSHANTLVPRSTVSDVSRSSAFSISELARLTSDEIDFLDAVISRAPASATTFIHIFKAYNDVISERGLDAENEVDYYKKLLKIGTLKGENWASKWRAVKAQNGYAATSASARAGPPLHKTTPQPPPPSAKVTPITPSQPSTARLLQRLKALQHTQPPEPSESAPDDLLSRTDVTDTETDFPLRAAPPVRGRPLSDLTTTTNSLGLDVGAVSGYPPSSTLAPSKPTGWRWSGRDPDIDKSVPFLTSTPPLSPHKLAPRTTPASIRQPVSHPVAISSTPRRLLADLRTANGRAADQDDALNKIRVAQDERSADQFRNARLLQRCFDVWKQGYDWVIATTAQIAHARDTFVLRIVVHKWRSALARRRERVAQADARANAYRQKTALAHWHAHLQERRKAAWRADMRVRMQTVRSLREAALRRDAWARWRQLYQSRLMQQRFAVRLVEGCFKRWKDRLWETDAMKGRADQLVVARQGGAVVRCWDSWVRAAELRRAERDVAERVGARVVRDSMVFWRQRTRERQRAGTLHDAAVKRFALKRWKHAHNRILILERRADKQIARQEDALVRAVVRVWKAHERGRLLERIQNSRLVRQAWEAWKKRLRHQRKLEDAALSFAQRSQVHVASSTLQVWHKRLAAKQGAYAFAVQYARAQLQFRILFKWRVQLRVHLRRFRQAKIAHKFFVMRQAWKIWVDKAEERGREKRLREWNKGRAGKLFAGWKERALRLRRHRLAEQEIQGRINARVLKYALGHWTNRVIVVKLRELEVVQQKNRAIVSSAFCKWKKVCIRHVEELSLMESYQDVKREENMRRMFYKWLTAARKVRHKRVTLQEREQEFQKIRQEAAWDKWRGRFQEEKLLPLERTFILQSQNVTMYRAFAIWRSKTRSLPAVHFHASHVRAKFWKVWRDAMPRALQAKQAREMDKMAVLSHALEKWLQVYRTKIALRAVARARQMRLPTSYRSPLARRSTHVPSRPRNLLPPTPTPARAPSPDEAVAAGVDQDRPTRPPPSPAQPKPRAAISSLLLPSHQRNPDHPDPATSALWAGQRSSRHGAQMHRANTAAPAASQVPRVAQRPSRPRAPSSPGTRRRARVSGRS